MGKIKVTTCDIEGLYVIELLYSKTKEATSWKLTTRMTLRKLV